MSPSPPVVLVPGAARPVGRAIARRFGQSGARLVLPTYDWPESVRTMRAEFDAAGFSYLALSCDLRQQEDVSCLFATLREHFGRLDVLVNNIERGGMPVVHGAYQRPVNSGQWELELHTTLTAKWLLFQEALPLLRQQRQAAVVNISSIAAETGRSGPSAPLFSEGYSAANRGIRSFTETWARQGAPQIRVNELMLGLIASRHGEGTRGWQSLTEAERQALASQILLGRQGTAAEVADAVYFLAMQAPYITGAVLRMDGGYLLGHAGTPPLPAGILENP